MDEFRLMNQVKEELCYLSEDFPAVLGKYSRMSIREKLQNNVFSMKKLFVLPDFQKVMKGYVKPDDSPIDPNEQVFYYAIILFYSFFVSYISNAIY